MNDNNYFESKKEKTYQSMHAMFKATPASTCKNIKDSFYCSFDWSMILDGVLIE